MHVFIVRPFGSRKTSDQKLEVDFDAVESLLIQPAIRKFERASAQRVFAATTIPILQAGSIRRDMFQELLLADLVIADVSIHNANVYYELGIRHALRNRATVLIRCKGDDVPFDLRTDRYLDYSPVEPARSVDDLADVILATVQAERTDSPVHDLMPELGSFDPTAHVRPDSSFFDEVADARTSRDTVRLSLFADELSDLSWAIPGLRHVAETQFKINDLVNARRTYTMIRDRRPTDVETLQRLATIDQKIGDRAASDAVLERLLQSPLTPAERSETLALRGSNEKADWILEWATAATLPERQRLALESARLQRALDSYAEGAKTNLNNYFAALNAVALLSLRAGLAAAQADLWASLNGGDDAAQTATTQILEDAQRLAAVVAVGLDHAHALDPNDDWIELSRGDAAAAFGDATPESVRSLYRTAAAHLARPPAGQSAPRGFNPSAAARQLSIFVHLGVRVDRARAGLKGLGAEPVDLAATIPVTAAQQLKLHIVFTGHRIDAPGRKVPRFPAAMEGVARSAIREQVEAVVRTAKAAGQTVHGFSGGASGGDILFHEVCGEVGIPTTVLLALDRNSYIRQSVADSGPGWVERFDAICRCSPPRILSDSKILPAWLVNKPQYTIWNRNNLWTLHHGLSDPAASVVLIALWNGAVGDGPGGTENMVEVATANGAGVRHIDTQKLFGLG